MFLSEKYFEGLAETTWANYRSAADAEFVWNNRLIETFDITSSYKIWSFELICKW